MKTINVAPYPRVGIVVHCAVLYICSLFRSRYWHPRNTCVRVFKNSKNGLKFTVTIMLKNRDCERKCYENRISSIPQVYSTWPLSAHEEQNPLKPIPVKIGTCSWNIEITRHVKFRHRKRGQVLSWVTLSTTIILFSSTRVAHVVPSARTIVL